MSEKTLPDAVSALKNAVAEYRTWFIVFGIVMIILGVLAIAHPLVTTIATKIVIGWLFLMGGVAQIIHAFQTQKWSEFFLNLLVAALHLVVGIWLAFFPLAGVITLTVLLALGFILQGALEAVMAFRMKPHEGWFWMFVSGAVAGLAGVLILAGLPGTAAWAIGLLVGINLISTGWAYLFLALAAGKGETAASDAAA